MKRGEILVELAKMPETEAREKLARDLGQAIDLDDEWRRDLERHQLAVIVDLAQRVGVKLESVVVAGGYTTLRVCVERSR